MKQIIVGENIIGAQKIENNFVEFPDCYFFQYCDCYIELFTFTPYLFYHSANFAIAKVVILRLILLYELRTVASFLLLRTLKVDIKYFLFLFASKSKKEQELEER